MRESIFETLVGLGVLIVAGVFLWFGLARGADAGVSGETVEIGARFNSAATIDRGTDVRMAGVKIGTVRDISLDRASSQAQATMIIDANMLPLSVNTTAQVTSDGLLGGAHIALSDTNGGDAISLCEGEQALFDGSGCGEIVLARGAIDAFGEVANFLGASTPLPVDTVYANLGARFSAANGIKPGTDVRMAGVKIGEVQSVALDLDRTEAKVVLKVDERILPIGDGTSARVQSQSLLGGTYINLEPAPGFGEIFVCEEGEELFGETGCGEILYAQGSVDLLTLFASFASGGGGGDSE
ncbi:MAG: MlaD family protein [Pseudomonadota bacterium]